MASTPESFLDIEERGDSDPRIYYVDEEAKAAVRVKVYRVESRYTISSQRAYVVVFVVGVGTSRQT